MLKRAIWVVLLVVALMSGALSIFRECMGLFAPAYVPAPALFWTSLRVAALVSFFALWLTEFKGRKEDQAQGELRLSDLRERLQNMERRLADDGPQTRLEWEKSVNNPRGGVLLTADKSLAEVRIQEVSKTNFCLTFETKRSIRPNEAVSLSAQAVTPSVVAGTSRDALFGYFTFFSEPLPLEVEYWDTRGNRFKVCWYIERLEREGLDGPEVHYALRQDPNSYCYIPPTQVNLGDSTPAP